METPTLTTPADVESVIETSISYFQEVLPTQDLQEHLGEWAVVKGRHILGFCEASAGPILKIFNEALGQFHLSGKSFLLAKVNQDPRQEEFFAAGFSV